MDFTPREILLAKRIRVILVEACEVISFVSEDDLASKLMAHSSKENAMEVVVILIPLDR